MAEDKKVVEALKEKLESISKSLWDLFVKFIITWGIPFDKLIHYFNQIKKDDLFGLVEGTHEITEKDSRDKLKIAFQNLKEVLERVSPGNNHLDGDILNWFNKTNAMNESGDVPLEVERLPKSLTHEEIIQSRKKAGNYTEVTLLQGIRESIKLIENGEIDKNRKGVIIYLSTRRNDGNFYRLYVWRYADGKLYVDVDKVDLGFRLDAGVGVLVSNKI